MSTKRKQVAPKKRGMSLKNRITGLACNIATNKIAADMLLDSFMYRIAKEQFIVTPEAAQNHYWEYGPKILGRLFKYTEPAGVAVKLSGEASKRAFFAEQQLA